MPLSICLVPALGVLVKPSDKQQNKDFTLPETQVKMTEIIGCDILKGRNNNKGF